MISSPSSSRIYWIVSIPLLIVLIIGGSILYSHFHDSRRHAVQLTGRDAAPSPVEIEQRQENMFAWAEILMFQLGYDSDQRSRVRASLDALNAEDYYNRFMMWDLLGSVAREDQLARLQQVRSVRVRRSDMIRASRLGFADNTEYRP